MGRGRIGAPMNLDKRIIYVTEKEESTLSASEMRSVLNSLKAISNVNVTGEKIFEITQNARYLKLLAYKTKYKGEELDEDVKSLGSQVFKIMSLYSACPGKEYSQTVMIPLWRTLQENSKYVLSLLNNKYKTDIDSFKYIQLDAEQLKMVSDRRKEVKAEYYVSPEQKKLQAIEERASNIKLVLPDFDSKTSITDKIAKIEKLIQERLIEIRKEDEIRLEREDKLRKMRDKLTAEDNRIKREILRKKEEALEEERARKAAIELNRDSLMKKVERKKEEAQLREKYKSDREYKFELGLLRLKENVEAMSLREKIDKLFLLTRTGFNSDKQTIKAIYNESIRISEAFKKIAEDDRHINLSEEVGTIGEIILFIEKYREVRALVINKDIPDYKDINTVIDIQTLITHGNEVYNSLLTMSAVLKMNEIALWGEIINKKISERSNYQLYVNGVNEEIVDIIIKDYKIINPKIKLEKNRVLALRGMKAIKFCDTYDYDKETYENKQVSKEKADETYRRNKEIKESYDAYAKQINDEIADIVKVKQNRTALTAWADHAEEIDGYGQLNTIRFNTIAANFDMSFERAKKIVESDKLFNKLAEKLWS